MSSKARSAVMELLSTEQSYSKSLHTMIENFQKPLRNEQFKLKPILREHDIDTIFGNVEDLMIIADDLREKLEKRIGDSAGDVVPKIGDIMCTIAPVLKLYQKYVSHFELASQRLVECREKWPGFSQFLDDNAARGGMPLDSFLIMPVQRIPRYKLLLEEIIKHKPDDDPDQADLQEALRKVKIQAEDCNEATRRRENIQKLREIQSRFKGWLSMHEATCTRFHTWLASNYSWACSRLQRKNTCRPLPPSLPRARSLSLPHWLPLTTDGRSATQALTWRTRAGVSSTRASSGAFAIAAPTLPATPFTSLTTRSYMRAKIWVKSELGD